MNQIAIEALEFNAIRTRLKEFAVTEKGQNQIEMLYPSNHLEKIRHQIDETTEAKSILNKTASIPLGNLAGIDLILGKLDKEMILSEEELSSTSQMIKSTGKLKRFMLEHSHLAPTITQVALSMYELSDVSGSIDQCISNNRLIDTASPSLEKIRKKIYIAEGRIKTKLGSMLQSSTLKNVLQDFNIRFINGHPVLSVKSEYKREVPGQIIDRSSTGATLFIEPEGVGKLNGELSLLKMEESNEEYQIRSFLTSIVVSYKREVMINIDTIVYYDFIFAKGKYSRSIDANPVHLNTKNYTKIKEGKHPLLGTKCVPLDFEIGDSYQHLIITGPNTGGKTVALKTVGLLTMMVQAGLHIPADPSSDIGIYSDVLVDIGDGQSIEQSLSTFSSHIRNIIEIMKCANKNTLVILDEIGAGTDPTEGEGLAIAILEELAKKGGTIIATSHYPKVKEFATSHPQFINGHMTFDINSLRPLYQLKIGAAGESNAFLVALQLGLNQQVIERAHRITYQEEKDYTPLYNNDKSTVGENLFQYERAAKVQVASEKIDPVYSPDQPLFQIGDMVYIGFLKQKGVIFSEENKKEEYGVMIRDKKMFIHKKRITLFIEGKELYPDNYDMDIVLKSKEYRKKNKIMQKRHEEGLILEYTEKDLL